MGLEEQLPGGILLSTVEKVAGYVRKGSLWPATFGLACCAIEMMATAGPRFDISRFGMERFSATPRQADLMIVAGRVSQKMAPVLRQIYDQMIAHEGKQPHELGYDRPSAKFLGFLAKHFGLKGYVPQANNFVVYDQYWSRGGDYNY